MSTVYVVQNSHCLDKRTGRLKPKFDLTPAQEYGELCFVYSPTCKPFQAGELVDEAYDKLCSYDPIEDYFLPVGSVALVCYAVSALWDVSAGNYQLLNWSNRSHSYTPIKVCTSQKSVL